MAIKGKKVLEELEKQGLLPKPDPRSTILQCPCCRKEIRVTLKEEKPPYPILWPGMFAGI